MFSDLKDLNPLVVSLYFLPPFSLTMKPVAGPRAHSYPAVIRSLVGYSRSLLLPGREG